MSRFPICDCWCQDWPCCEHTDNFPDDPENFCPYCGRPDCFGECDDEPYDDDDDEHDGMTDVEADADTLRSCGFGTDEDYEHDTPLGDDYGGE